MRKQVYLVLILLTCFATTSYSQSPSKSKIVPDDYFVTNDMLVDTSSNSSLYIIKSGEIFSLEKVWFANDSLKQTLVFELHTDYHRLSIYHFYNNDTPLELIKGMPLYYSQGPRASYEGATYQQKEKYFKGFVNQSIRINQSYFTTKKGFRLGDKKEKAIEVYGAPDSCITNNGIERCHWNFIGDYPVSEETRPKPKTNKPLAANSFGYAVTMFFRKDKLIAMILFNDIP